MYIRTIPHTHVQRKQHKFQPVQHSVMTASSLRFFLRAVTIPFERSSPLNSSGTIPGALANCDSAAVRFLGCPLVDRQALWPRETRRARKIAVMASGSLVAASSIAEARLCSLDRLDG